MERAKRLQPSQLYRRGVVLPLDDDAENTLRRGDPDHNTRVERIEISDDLFYLLWDARIFEEINNATDSILDDYEEDWIPRKRLNSLTKALDRLSKLHGSASEIGMFVLELSDLLLELREEETVRVEDSLDRVPGAAEGRFLLVPVEGPREPLG